MSPAVVKITQVEGEARKACTSCRGDLTDSALKCNNCQKYIHLSCSNVPKYMLIRFSIAQASYNCPSCVKIKDLSGDEEKYSEEATKIAEIIAKESSLVSKAAEVTNKSNDEIPTDLTTIDNSDQNSQNGSESTPTKKPTCRYYLRNSCKHGKKGATCKFDHPKLCFKFIKNGDKRGGCNKGTNCNFVHPKLCNSYKSGVCRRPNCSFYHTKSTKISRDDFSSTPSTPRADRVSTVSQGDRGRQPDAAPMRILQRPQNIRERSSDSDMRQDNFLGQTDQRDFLEMKSQMKSIQETLQLLLVGRTPLVEADRALPRSAVWGQR